MFYILAYLAFATVGSIILGKFIAAGNPSGDER